MKYQKIIDQMTLEEKCYLMSGKQIVWYVLAFIVINCIVNSINCVWVAVAGLFVPDFVYNIGTVVRNGGISIPVILVSAGIPSIP